MVVTSVRKELRSNITLKCLDKTEIERVEIMKYLSIIIDYKLRFKDHCNYMFKKIGKKTSFLNRISNFISTYIRCIICWVDVRYNRYLFVTQNIASCSCA